jgi:glycosyltransferase involved in cell wall biosynthesis
MRLVIDMQGAQTASRFRGIGRYTLALVTEMARQRGSHEMLLVLNGAYADTIEPLRAAFAELLPYDAIRVFEVAGPVEARDAANEARRKAAEAMREAFIASLKPDLILICTLFDEDLAISSVHSLHNTIPTVVILYDLIPLIHRSIYLQDQAGERRYFGKLGHLKRADLLLSISESSGREAIERLNFPESQVINISTACDAQFHPFVLSDAQRSHLKTAYGIDRPFVMAAGDADARKNLDGLFRAFARLPAEQRSTYALVIPGRGVADHKSHFLGVAQQAGLREGELILPGYVPDQDLVLLYNACTLFVFPSWHEGFGMPVLEAMACGKAAIAAKSSSLPEVVGRADALFAPRDDAAMSAKMAEVLGHPEFRQELERHGLEQAKKFSWHTSAERAWAALHALHAQHQQRAATAALCTPSKRPRLAFVSPLPPEKTGIADYAAELLPELSRHYDITVIVQQAEVADAWVQANAPIRNAAWFRQHAQQFDRVVYQFGNSDRHVYMFDLLAEIPGMVVLHDFYLSGVLAWVMEEQAAHRFSWTKALHAAHGWNAVQQRFCADNNEALVWQYPCNLSVLQHALGVIVHSDYSRRLARQFYGQDITNDWALIPHLRQAASAVNKDAARKQLGLTQNEFVVCSFGVIGATKLNKRLLDAWLASPLAQDAACRLVFVGENHGGDYGQALMKTITQSPAKDRISITGWADVETYRTWLAAADVGVQLRTLSRGETSGTVLDCMNYGLPTIVNANGSMADLPADAVWLLPDVFDDAQLVDALVGLHRDASKRAALGERARQHILTQHNPRTCAEQYVQAIESAHSQAQLGLQGLLHALPRLNPALPLSEYPALAGTLAANFPPNPRRRQLLLDVSALVNTDLWSGIERVTRALMTELIKSPLTGWAVEPVYATADQPGYRYARKFTSRFLKLPDDWAEDAPVQVWQGDIFFGLDLQSHVIVAQESTLQSWRSRGVKCYFVIYDLLPVTMPEVFPDGARDGHQRWLQTVSRFDGALCISREVADEMFDWLQTFGGTRQRPFALDWFHLGADVDNSAPSLGLPGDAAQTLAALKARPSFLMVGTIEPRKGYLQTLHAFDALWAQGVDVNLVIVGKEGWKPLPDHQRRDIPQTVQAFRNHAEQGKHLFWLEGISDEYLEQIYAHASCLIAASYDEGFGLPLIEAALHGVPLLVRDIPVFREVTDGHAYYFADRREPQVIQDAIQQWLVLFEQGTHPRSTAMPHQTWSESAQQLLDGIFARTAPYKTWLPDGVRRYWGADPRLHTEVGECRGKAIQSTGKAGMLIYGPYEQFEPGRYRVVLTGESKHWTGEEWLDVTCDVGKRKLFYSDLGAKPLGVWHQLFEFELREFVTDLEIRFYVSSGTKAEINMIIITMENA